MPEQRPLPYPKTEELLDLPRTKGLSIIELGQGKKEELRDSSFEFLMQDFVEVRDG